MSNQTIIRIERVCVPVFAYFYVSQYVLDKFKVDLRYGHSGVASRRQCERHVGFQLTTEIDVAVILTVSDSVYKWGSIRAVNLSINSFI